MKKLITFVLLMFVGIGLVGCQNDSKKSEGNPKVKQSKVHTAKSEPFQELIDSSKSTDEIYVTDDITVGEKGDVKPGIYDIEVPGGSGNIFGTRKSGDGPHINAFRQQPKGQGSSRKCEKRRDTVLNIVCDKTLLSAAIDGVSKAVTMRSSIPVLEGILLKAEGWRYVGS